MFSGFLEGRYDWSVEMYKWMGWKSLSGKKLTGITYYVHQCICWHEELT